MRVLVIVALLISVTGAHAARPKKGAERCPQIGIMYVRCLWKMK